MYGDFDTELRGDVPKREAMTTGDMLLIVVVLFLGWCAVYGLATMAAKVGAWLLGVL